MIHPPKITSLSPSIENLPSLQSQEFLPPISRWTTLGGILMLGTVALSLVLAATTKYRVTVRSQAIIRPAGEVRLVQAAREGQIVEIRGKENQTVKKGDVIAILDNSQVTTQKSQLEIQIEQTQLKLDRFDTQIEAIDRQIAAETERYRRTANLEEAKLALSQRTYRDKQITTDAAVLEAEANLKSSQNEWQKARSQLKSAQAEYKSVELSLQSAQKKLDRYQKVSNEGALSQEQIDEAQLEVKQQKEKLNSQQANIEIQENTIEQLQQNINAAEAKLQSARSTLNPTNAEVEIATENIDREKATGESTIAALDREKASLMQSKIEVKRQLEKDKKELQQVQINLQQTKIIATTDGIIARLNLRNSGQIVRLGEEIAQIVPSNNPLAIETTVSPSEINKLKIGQKVQMQVSACPYPDYGTLDGTVSQISVDTIKSLSNNIENNSSNIARSFSAYKVIVRPNSSALDRGNNKCAIRSGMEGKAEIIAEEETFLQFLLRKARLITNS